MAEILFDFLTPSSAKEAGETSRNGVRHRSTQQLPNTEIAPTQATQGNPDLPEDVAASWKKVEPLVLQAVHADLLGDEQSGIRKFWYSVDPFKEDQFVRAPKKFSDANIIFMMIFYACLFGYAFFAFWQFFHRPAVENWTLTLTSDTEPLSITVSLSCSTNWGCSNLTDSGWIGPQITEKYERVAKGYCGNTASSTQLTNSYSSAELDLTSCYSSAFSDGILIDVPFTEDYDTSSAVLTVDITSSGSEFYTQQFLEPGQRKSVFIGQTLYRQENGDEDVEPSLGELFYDGKNKDTSGQLRIKMKQFTETSESTRPGTVLDVFGSIGGFASLLLPIVTILLKAVVRLVYKGAVEVEHAIEDAIHQHSEKSVAAVAAEEVTAGQSVNGNGDGQQQQSAKGGFWYTFGSGSVSSRKKSSYNSSSINNNNSSIDSYRKSGATYAAAAVHPIDGTYGLEGITADGTDTNTNTGADTGYMNTDDNKIDSADKVG